MITKKRLASMLTNDSIKRKLENAAVLCRNNKHEQAIEICNAIIDVDKQCYAAYDERSYNLFRLKKYNQALEDVDRLVELNPQSPAPYFKRAGWNLKLGKYQESISDFDFVINTKEEYFLNVAHFERAIAYLKLGNKEKSLHDCLLLPPDFKFRVKTPDQEGHMLSRDQLHELIIKLS